jgi:exopolysaccharide production protein ExoY
MNMTTIEKACCPPTERRVSRDSYVVVSHNPLPAWKRGLDLFCLLLLAPALVPVMLAIALYIKLSSRGPVFFKQERIGLRGEPFLCFKFRTMRPDAETKSHAAYLAALVKDPNAPMQKLDDGDKRIIPFGGIIRASGLDELPQIFNIVRGEMSFVGPRPCIRYEYEKYSDDDRKRVNAVPGLTGLWQVSGKNDTTFREMVQLDVEYASRLSFWRDLSIMLRTGPVLLDQVGRVVKRKLAKAKTR